MAQLVRHYVPAFPKPGHVKREKPWIRIFPNGREVLDIKMRQGFEEYHRRKWKAWERQKGICCLYGFISKCPGMLAKCDTEFEHEHGRGSGGSKRDDRILLPDGRWQNGAAHRQCNQDKGSRYFPYNQARNQDANSQGAE